MGQTPPPWHGQAVATQILFDHDWPDFEVQRVRMEFSEEMEEVGRFQWRKLGHLASLIHRVRCLLKRHPGSILFYPPASAKWVPFLRDVVFLFFTRHLAGSTVFIFHANGLPVFVDRNSITRLLGERTYQGADLALEVAQEVLPPHRAFAAKAWHWCPCAIEVPEIPQRAPRKGPLEILFVGSLQEGKGILEILRTAALLRERSGGEDFRFRIVGKWFSADFEDSTRRLQNELALGSMVEFSGQLTGAEKWQAYAAADVFFFPTHYASEATPIVLMEALGAGLPVVSTEWAGIPAMLEGCGTARLLPVRSPSAYAAALEELRAMRSRLAGMDGESREFYRSRFLPSRFVERVESGLLDVVSALPAGSDPEPAPPAATPLSLAVYLADQNPGYDRSYGISRMSHTVLAALSARSDTRIHVVASATSQQGPDGVDTRMILPWGTRNKVLRLVTDHLHPLLRDRANPPDVCYYPKGFLPGFHGPPCPTVVTIHDAILQYYWDHYPSWRNSFEYSYWARMLKHTLRAADCILTVSHSAKRQIVDFMLRHDLPPKEILVTYEPCLYEPVPQPVEPVKEDFVIHLASREPHKKTTYLVRWWIENGKKEDCPPLHLVGSLPPEASALAKQASNVIRRPFLEDAELRSAMEKARALILPSEIEGFGLPGIEAYYLGTPVCHVAGTSVEEILAVATSKGRFSLEDPQSLAAALREVFAMEPSEIRNCGLALREAYSTTRVAASMMEAFRDVASRHPRGR